MLYFLVLFLLWTFTNLIVMDNADGFQNLNENTVVVLIFIKLRLSATHSEEYEQEAGVPPGGILFTSLFILKINRISDCLACNIENLLKHVDNCCLLLVSIHNMAERKLQLILNWMSLSRLSI